MRNQYLENIDHHLWEYFFFRNSTNANNPNADQGLGRKLMVKPKMDLGKALATMGFGTARLDDVHGKRDAQDELNNSLTRLMEAHEKKKKKLLETEKIEQRREQMANKLRDEIRTVHEAYQFLSRKYQIDKEKLKEKEKEMQQIQQQQLGEGVMDDDEDLKKDEAIGLGTAVALKSAANVFKGKIEGAASGKETNNKTAKRSIRGKLDSNEEKNDNIATNPSGLTDQPQ